MKYVLNPACQHLRPFIENIEKHFQQSTEVLYDQRNQIRLITYEGERYVVKAFKIPNIINQFAYRYLRPSKARRSYEYSIKIGEKLCPQAIAYIEKYKNTLLEKSYYVSKYYDYDFTIQPVLLDDNFDNNIRKLILEELADFSCELHNNNILHRDFSYGNILIKKVSHHYQFKIIDVNRMQFKALSLNDRLKSFARLSAKDEYMKIIIGQYAKCIGEPVDKLLPIAKEYRDDFIKNRVLKNKMRGR